MEVRGLRETVRGSVKPALPRAQSGLHQEDQVIRLHVTALVDHGGPELNLCHRQKIQVMDFNRKRKRSYLSVKVKKYISHIELKCVFSLNMMNNLSGSAMLASAVS